MSEYYEALQKIKDRECKNCQGSGKCDDMDFGDIYYNQWTCPECKGTGFEKGDDSEGS